MARPATATARFELGDIQQLLGQSKEAAATYQQLLADKAMPQREPELLQRLAAALNLAGDYDGSDKICERFEQLYPKNPLRAAVLFRQAENAAFRYLAAEKDPNVPNRAAELKRLGAEAAKHYEAVAAQFPEFEYANLARFGLALGYYRQGNLEKAAALFAAIPGPDRLGDLAVVSYLHADCLIRQAPAKVEDAVSAGKLREALQPAIDQLEAFAGSQPKGSPLAAEALLKLGHCYQRLAAITGQPAERTKLLQSCPHRLQENLRRLPAAAPGPGQRGLRGSKVLHPDERAATGVDELAALHQGPVGDEPGRSPGPFATGQPASRPEQAGRWGQRAEPLPRTIRAAAAQGPRRARRGIR